MLEWLLEKLFNSDIFMWYRAKLYHAAYEQGYYDYEMEKGK